MKKLTPEKARKVYCAINGHTKIVSLCFGYVNCARCGDQIGDTLGGCFDLEKAVVVSHNCDTCRKNLVYLTKRDKTNLPKEIRNYLAELQATK